MRPRESVSISSFQNTEAEINYIKTHVKYESEEKETLKDCQGNCLMYLKTTIMKLYSTL